MNKNGSWIINSYQYGTTELAEKNTVLGSFSLYLLNGLKWILVRKQTLKNKLEAKSKHQRYFCHPISAYISGKHYSPYPNYIRRWLCKQAQTTISSKIITTRSSISSLKYFSKSEKGFGFATPRPPPSIVKDHTFELFDFWSLP